MLTASPVFPSSPVLKRSSSRSRCPGDFETDANNRRGMPRPYDGSDVGAGHARPNTYKIAASREFVNELAARSCNDPDKLLSQKHLRMACEVHFHRHDIQTSWTIWNYGFRGGAWHMGPRRMDVGRH
jgi:hypothetical protein